MTLLLFFFHPPRKHVFFFSFEGIVTDGYYFGDGSGRYMLFVSSSIHNLVIEMQYIDEEAIRELFQKAGNVALLSNSSRGASALVQRRYKSEPAFGMMDLARKINQREAVGGRIGSRASPTSWVFGEYKVFGWVLACLSKASQLEIGQFGAPELRQLEVIFRAKTPYFLRYQTKMFASHKHASSQFWDPQEIETLQNLLLNYPTAPNWKDISYQLFCISQGRFFRTLNQCREKWMNHLNPNVSKERWSVEEDRLLFELAEQYGCRWARISKEMGSRRTEHMVKNRYNWYTRRVGRKRCPNDITRILKNCSHKDLEDSQSDAFSEFQLSERERREIKESLQRGELKEPIEFKVVPKQRRSRLPRVAKQPKVGKQSIKKKCNKQAEQEQCEKVNQEQKEESVQENQQISSVHHSSERQHVVIAKQQCNYSEEIESISQPMKGQVMMQEDLSPVVQVKEQWGRERVKIEGGNKKDVEEEEKKKQKKDKADRALHTVKMEDSWQNYYPFLHLMMPHPHWN